MRLEAAARKRWFDSEMKAAQSALRSRHQIKWLVIRLLVPHHLPESRRSICWPKMGTHGSSPASQCHVICRGQAVQGRLFWRCLTEHAAALKVPLVRSSQLVKDTAPKAVVIWSTIEMRLQGAVRHDGWRLQPIEFDRSLNGLILFDATGNLQSGKISAMHYEPSDVSSEPKTLLSGLFTLIIFSAAGATVYCRRRGRDHLLSGLPMECLRR